MTNRTSQGPYLGNAGPYELLARIGKGGFGEVYKGRKGNNHEVLAVKVMHPGQDPERFLREAEMLTRLNHVHTVRVHDSGTDSEGRSFIAMDLLSGTSLLDRLKLGPLSLTDVLKIADAVLSALAFSHESGILHRDVKPANVFLSKSPGGTHTRLLDFGVGRVLTRQTRLTIEGSLVGSPGYMAPEVLRGGEASKGSDLWAVGILIVEMATGRPAYRGSRIERLRAVLDGPPPSLSLLSSPLREVVARALGPCEARYASAAEFRSALKLRSLDPTSQTKGPSKPTVSLRRSTHLKSGPKSLRPWIALKLAAAVLLGLGLLGALWSWTTDPSSETSSPEAPEAPTATLQPSTPAPPPPAPASHETVPEVAMDSRAPAGNMMLADTEGSLDVPDHRPPRPRTPHSRPERPRPERPSPPEATPSQRTPDLVIPAVFLEP